MVALKAAEVDAYIAARDPARPIALVFGPDAGLVSESADAIVRAAVDDPNDPFSLVRLDGDELASDPSRLIDEANTVPLFGGRRAIRVKAGGVRWQIRPECREELLGPEGLRLQEWLWRGQAAVVKHGPHRTVYRVALTGGQPWEITQRPRSD